MKMFSSDNNSGVHEDIMQAIINENKGHAIPYGKDMASSTAEKAISKLFNSEVDVYFVSTGTAANIIGIEGLTRPFQAVICADTGHINVDECGALEKFTGSKIITVPNRDGKIYKEDIKGILSSIGEVHHSQPKLIYISQTTETGTLYTVDEIRDLAKFAHENNMYLHMDGARIANAIVALDTSFEEMVTDTGVDLLSFGGTKNGMMMGESIISFDKRLSENFKFHRKQGMQLMSKMRFLAVQFTAYLKDDLWRKNALKANEMGEYLISELSKIEGVELVEGLKTNMVFAKFPDKAVKYLQEEYQLHLLDADSGLMRLVTSFDTTKEDVDKLINSII